MLGGKQRADAVVRQQRLGDPVEAGQSEAHPQTYIAEINGNWTSRQVAARDHRYSELMSPAFTAILENHGLKRP